MVAYQSNVDTVKTIQEREDQMARRHKELEEEIAVLKKQLGGREEPGTARALAEKVHSLQMSLEQAERAMSEAVASQAAMKVT
jgi:seryl-tRNA synthetase